MSVTQTESEVLIVESETLLGYSQRIVKAINDNSSAKEGKTSFDFRIDVPGYYRMEQSEVNEESIRQMTEISLRGETESIQKIVEKFNAIDVSIAKEMKEEQ